ncbi:MAG: TetR/AcrR family transcriptional regulator [Solirubrobacteraceae bacterium]
MTANASKPTRERILAAAAKLLADGGEDEASTRAVSAAAGVQAPTIYRLFGDKQGLLDAVAVDALETYLSTKSRRSPGPDPVEDLRAGWDEHVAFALAHPEVYALLRQRRRHGDPPPAALAAAAVLQGNIHRIAVAGRLRIPEHLAVQLVQASGSGVAAALIATPEAERDPQLSSIAREAVIAGITAAPHPSAPPGRVGAAITLLASLDDADALTAAERTLLREWLDRIAKSAA